MSGLQIAPLAEPILGSHDPRVQLTSPIMDLGTVLVALPVIFMSAFVAVVLENMRERRRARRWALRSVHMFTSYTDRDEVNLLLERVNLLQRWLDATSPDAFLDDGSWWHQLSLFQISWAGPPDLSVLVRSDAADALPRDVFEALYRIEGIRRSLQWRWALMCEQFERDVLRLCREHEAPLTEIGTGHVTEHLNRVVDITERLHEFSARKRNLAKLL